MLIIYLILGNHTESQFQDSVPKNVIGFSEYPYALAANLFLAVSLLFFLLLDIKYSDYLVSNGSMYRLLFTSALIVPDFVMSTMALRTYFSYLSLYFLELRYLLIISGVLGFLSGADKSTWSIHRVLFVQISCTAGSILNIFANFASDDIISFYLSIISYAFACLGICRYFGIIFFWMRSALLSKNDNNGSENVFACISYSIILAVFLICNWTIYFILGQRRWEDVTYKYLTAYTYMEACISAMFLVASGSIWRREYARLQVCIWLRRYM